MDKITITHGRHDMGEVKTETFLVDDLCHVYDGYHTISELYDHRITLYIALCKAKQYWVYPPGMRNEVKDGYDKIVWRSKKHSDGKDAYRGWFIMGIGRVPGFQIT